ncbi:hypothetical protein [Arthrobacter sp. VKM Ac-2550]|uniref:hypothetical protein n=1 Tax=Crystallibacter permensis TaxID=1938888 RepID=UPI00222802A5|nr:hypothetical protein [Arthrobacter sp. VKM Ac-2550]MCW2131573.1 hypothetical protein [Arthrobacter sp. VKM Ac-2550]
MDTTEQFCQPFVSIQKPGPADVEERHTVWGTLISDSLVLCRDSSWTQDVDRDWEVLLATDPRNGSAAVERIKMDEIDILGHDGAGSGSVAMIRLAHTPRYPVRTHVNLDDIDEDVFTQGLGDNWDVCAALQAAGALPSEPQDGPVGQVLGPVADWEAADEKPRIKRYDPAADQPSGRTRTFAQSAQDAEKPAEEPEPPSRILLCFFKRCG